MNKAMLDRADLERPLRDDELEALEYHGCSSGTSTQPMVRDAIVRATRELRRHRAMVKRLEVWAKWLDGAWPSERWQPIAAELRNCMRGE